MCIRDSAHPREDCAHLDPLVGLAEDSQEGSGHCRFDFVRRLVGLGLEQRLALGDLFALSLEPGDESELVAGLSERRHANRACHG